MRNVVVTINGVFIRLGPSQSPWPGLDQRRTLKKVYTPTPALKKLFYYFQVRKKFRVRVNLSLAIYLIFDFCLFRHRAYFRTL
jgi:hypothetical protein